MSTELAGFTDKTQFSDNTFFSDNIAVTATLFSTAVSPGPVNAVMVENRLWEQRRTSRKAY